MLCKSSSSSPTVAALALFTSCAQQDMNEFFPESEAESIEAVALVYEAEAQASEPSTNFDDLTIKVTVSGQDDTEAGQLQLKETFQVGEAQTEGDRGVHIQRYEESSESDELFWEGPAEMAVPIEPGAPRYSNPAPVYKGDGQKQRSKY